MIWEMPAEPEGVTDVWQAYKAPTDGYRHWSRTDASYRPWRLNGSDVHCTWNEVLGKGPVTDVDPTPKPPQMVWSPSLSTVYAKDGNMWVRVWGHGSSGVRPNKPADAIPMVGGVSEE